MYLTGGGGVWMSSSPQATVASMRFSQILPARVDIPSVFPAEISTSLLVDANGTDEPAKCRINRKRGEVSASLKFGPKLFELTADSEVREYFFRRMLQAYDAIVVRLEKEHAPEIALQELRLVLAYVEDEYFSKRPVLRVEPIRGELVKLKNYWIRYSSSEQFNSAYSFLAGDPDLVVKRLPFFELRVLSPTKDLRGGMEEYAEMSGGRITFSEYNYFGPCNLHLTCDSEVDAEWAIGRVRKVFPDQQFFQHAVGEKVDVEFPRMPPTDSWIEGLMDAIRCSKLWKDNWSVVN